MSGLSQAAQLEALTSYIKSKMKPGDEMEILEDPEVSAKFAFFERKSGKWIGTYIQPGDAMVITKVDRAFRRTRDALKVLDKFLERKIGLHVLDLGGGTVDFSTAIGRAFFSMLCVFAELERAFGAERSKAAQDVLRKSGKRNCHLPKPGFKWGYNPKEHAWYAVVDEDARAIMRNFYEWHAVNGMSEEHIRQHMNNVLKIHNRWGKKKNGGQTRKPWSKSTIVAWIKAEHERRIDEGAKLLGEEQHSPG